MDFFSGDVTLSVEIAISHLDFVIFNTFLGKEILVDYLKEFFAKF